MTKARGIFCVHAGLGAFGTGVTVLAFMAAAINLQWQSPAPGALAEACGSFTLPALTASSVLALVLGAGAFAVLALGTHSALRQLRGSRRFLRDLQTVGGPRSGPAGAIVFDDETPTAFCAGLVRPRVYVSTGALSTLQPDELRAVLAHECHHAMRRDPLRLSAMRTVSDALFFVPAMRRVGDRYSALVEIAADTAAVRAMGGDRRPLAAALLAFDATPDPAVVGIAPERVDTLVGAHPQWQLPVTRIGLALVVLGAVGALSLRLAAASEQTAVNLPMALAQSCMLAMAVSPLVVGAAGALSSRRLLRRH